MFDYSFQSIDFLVDSTFIFNNPYCFNLDYNLYFFSFCFISKTFKIFSGVTSTSLFLYSICPNLLYDAIPLYAYNNHIFMAFDYKLTSLDYLYTLLWKVDYYFHLYYIIYLFYFILLLIYLVYFQFIFKIMYKFILYMYKFILYMINTFTLNSFLRDAFNINFFKSLFYLYKYFYTSWVFYLQWEYKYLFDNKIPQLKNPIFTFVVTYLCAARYVDIWSDTTYLWRYIFRLFFKLFYLPFCVLYVFITRLVFFYLDYFGFVRYIYFCIYLSYWRFLKNLNSIKAEFISKWSFKFLNGLAFFMFFDFHFSINHCFYSFLPTKFHLHDPITFGSSYPAVMHPWVTSLLKTIRFDYSFNIKCYSSFLYIQGIFTSLMQYIQIKFICTLEYLFNLIFYFLKLNLGFTYILLLKNLKISVFRIILLYPYKLNLYLFLLIFLYLFFCSSLFIILFLFLFFILVYIFKNRLSFISRLLLFFFIMVGFICYIPYYIILYIIRFIVFILVFTLTSFFNVFFILLLFFVFLKFDTIYIFEFLWYVFKGIAFDWIFDYLNFYVLGAILEFHFNWKTFFIENIHSTVYYLHIASTKYNFRLKYYHYYDMFFNSLGIWKWHAFKLWFNNIDLYTRRINIFYYLRFSYWFYSFYLYLLKGPQSVGFYFTHNSLFLFYFYFRTLINYFLYNFNLHVGLFNSLFFKYYFILNYLSRLPKYYYIYVCPVIFWFKSFYYLNIMVNFFSYNIKLFFLFFTYTISNLFLYIRNFDYYSFFYFYYLVFYSCILNMYYFILDVLFYFHYTTLDNEYLLFNFIRRVHLYTVLSCDYFCDYLYSYLRLSRFKLDDFINCREFYMTKANWK